MILLSIIIYIYILQDRPFVVYVSENSDLSCARSAVSGLEISCVDVPSSGFTVTYDYTYGTPDPTRLVLV